MPRRGENIYKRKDGRWEARYIYAFKEDGSPRYRSIYAADYLTVKKKQNDAKRKMDPRLFQSVRMKKNISFYGLLWLKRLKPSSKESTYVRYHYLFSHYISPMIGDRLVYTFSNKDCEVFLNRLLVSGKSDGSGLAPKTVTDIRSVVKLILKTAEKEGELSLCNPELCSVKSVRKPLRILSLKEQQDLQDYLLGNLTHKNIGTLIALYTGVRLGELCAMQWKDIHFQEQYLEISKTLHRVKDHTDDSEHNTKIIITPPKTESSIRNIPIPDFLFEILQQYVQSHTIDPEVKHLPYDIDTQNIDESRRWIISPVNADQVIKCTNMGRKVSWQEFYDMVVSDEAYAMLIQWVTDHQSEERKYSKKEIYEAYREYLEKIYKYNLSDGTESSR